MKRRRSRKPLIIGGIAVALIVLIGCAWFFFLRKPESKSSPTMNSIVLYSDSAPLIAGIDGTAHMRLNIPKGSGDATICDGDGNEVAFFRAEDMEDNGDGILRAEFDVTIPGRKAGVQTYSVSTSGGKGSRGGESSNTNNGSLRIPVIPNNVDPKPARTEGSWVLADACDWVDNNCEANMARTEAATGLMEYLTSDGRAKSVTQYGSTVMFGVGEEENSALYCICLDPIKEGMLGSGDNHSFASDGSAVRVYNALGDTKEAPVGMGITAGNFITNSDVLLLDPTPSLMNEACTKDVEEACGRYALAQGGVVIIRTTATAFASILQGDLYGKGAVVLRAHGISPDNSGVSLLQMRSSRKNPSDDWVSVQTDLDAFLQSTAESSSINMGEIFFGLPDVPDTWRCAITVKATNETGVWDIGVSMTTNLIEERYANMDFESSILCLSSCGGLSKPDFASWALAHGAQFVFGYEGAVRDQDDAQIVSSVLSGLAAEPSNKWRGMNVGEALRGIPVDVAKVVGDSIAYWGNESLFERGSGTLLGTVSDRDGEPITNATVEAWRYFGLSFKSQDSVATNADGTFAFEGLPCGRYVLVAQSQNESCTCTAVLDEEQVDGGTIVIDVEIPNDEEQSSPKDTFGLGVANGEVAADDDWYYLGVGSNSDVNGTSSMPKIVRVSRDDTSKYDVLWEGSLYANVMEVRVDDNRILFYLVPWSDQQGSTIARIMSIQKDGSEARTIAEIGGPSYSSEVFVASDDKVFFGHGNGDDWEVHAVNLDGSGEIKICAGSTPRGNASVIRMLGVYNGEVFFAVPSSGSDSGFYVVYATVVDGGGDYREVVRTGGYSVPALLGNRLYVTDLGEFVSYSLEGNDRSVVMRFAEEVAESYLVNMSSRYALVLGSQKCWVIDVDSHDAWTIDYTGEDIAVNLVGDEFITVFLDQAFQRRGLDFSIGELLWPVQTVADVASDTANSDEKLEEQQDVPEAPGRYTLSGRVHVHDEFHYGKNEYVQVVSLVLDNPVPYTYEYKGMIDAEAKDVALEVTSVGEYGSWVQYDGEHITVSCEELRGVYHDASYYNVDSMALGEITLLSVDD